MVIEEVSYPTKEEALAYTHGIMALSDMVLDYGDRSVETLGPTFAGNRWYVTLQDSVDLEDNNEEENE